MISSRHCDQSYIRSLITQVESIKVIQVASEHFQRLFRDVTHESARSY